MCKNRFELAPFAASGNAAWTQRAVLNRGKTSGVQEHGCREHLSLAKIATPPCLPVGVEARAVLSWPPFLKVTGGHASPCMARIPLLCKKKCVASRTSCSPACFLHHKNISLLDETVTVQHPRVNIKTEDLEDLARGILGISGIIFFERFRFPIRNFRGVLR